MVSEVDNPHSAPSSVVLDPLHHDAVTHGHPYSSKDWDLVSFRVEDQTYYAPRFKFIYAEISPGNDNPIAVEIAKMAQSGAHYAIKVSEGISTADFETLLKLLYPISNAHARISNIGTPLLDRTEWLSILKISTAWYYKELRALALEHLENTYIFEDSVEKIMLGRTYHIPKWSIEGLREIARARTFISSATSAVLGHATTLRLYQIRERRDHSEARDDTDDGIFSKATEYVGVESDVRAAFGAELESSMGMFNQFATHPSSSLQVLFDVYEPAKPAELPSKPTGVYDYLKLATDSTPNRDQTPNVPRSAIPVEPVKNLAAIPRPETGIADIDTREGDTKKVSSSGQDEVVLKRKKTKKHTQSEISDNKTVEVTTAALARKSSQVSVVDKDKPSVAPARPTIVLSMSTPELR